MHHFKYTYYYLFNKNYISVQLSYWVYKPVLFDRYCDHDYWHIDP